MTKSEIFKAAWKLSKDSSNKFGGNASQYFSLSLKAIYSGLTSTKIFTSGSPFSVLKRGMIIEIKGEDIKITDRDGYRTRYATLYKKIAKDYLYKGIENQYLSNEQIEQLKFMSNYKY